MEVIPVLHIQSWMYNMTAHVWSDLKPYGQLVWVKASDSINPRFLS